MRYFDLLRPGLFALVATLGLNGCMDAAAPPQSSAPTSRSAALLNAFSTGCLNEARSMRQALRAFAANGLSYKEPFGRALPSRPLALGAVRIPSGVPIPDRNDRNWDTRLLACTTSGAGVFGSDAHGAVVQSLAQAGFRAETPLPRPSEAGPSRVSGVYIRAAVRYRVTISQRIATNPNRRSTGDTRFVRGNSRTAIALDSLTEPVGWRLPGS